MFKTVTRARAKTAREFINFRRNFQISIRLPAETAAVDDKLATVASSAKLPFPGMRTDQSILRQQAQEVMDA